MVELLEAIPWWGWALACGVGCMLGFASIALLALHAVRTNRDQ